MRLFWQRRTSFDATVAFLWFWRGDISVKTYLLTDIRPWRWSRIERVACSAWMCVGGVARRQFHSSDVRGPSRRRWLQVRHCPAAGQSLEPADTWRQTSWPRPIPLHHQHQSHQHQSHQHQSHQHQSHHINTSPINSKVVSLDVTGQNSRLLNTTLD